MPPRDSATTTTDSTKASYFDDHANFFLASDVHTNDLLYKTAFTSCAVAELHPDETASVDAATFGPHVVPVMDHILKEALALPLGSISTRNIPLPRRRPIGNSAREKWSHVSFDDKNSVTFHNKLSTEVLQLRLAWQKCNTTCALPDCVPDDALNYYAPREEFGLAWEMFDAGVHCDRQTLEAVVERKKQEAVLEQTKDRLVDVFLASRGGGGRPSRSDGGSPSSPKAAAAAASSGMSPAAAHRHGGALDTKEQLASIAAAALQDHHHGGGSKHRAGGGGGGVQQHEWEEEAQMDEEQLMSYYERDVQQDVKEFSKQEYTHFVPPERHRIRRARNLEIAQRKAEQWHPLKLKTFQPTESTHRAHVTSIPALMPFFSCGIADIDPYQSTWMEGQTKSSLSWGDVMSASL